MLLFYLELGSICTKISRYVEYTPVKCPNNFVQSAVSACRQGDEVANSSVVAETMKSCANWSNAFQIMDRSHHSTTKYTKDEKTHAAINKNDQQIGAHQ